MNTNYEAVIICERLDSDITPVKGSGVTNCDKCDERIWLSDSGRTSYSEHNPSLMCTSCAAEKFLDDPNAVIEPISKEVLQNCLDNLPASRHEAFKKFVSTPGLVRKILMQKLERIKNEKKAGEKIGTEEE